MKAILKEIRIFADNLEKGGSVLDVGCGLRPYEQFFKEQRYTGIDVEKSGRESKDKKPDKYYDGLNIPYDNASFDVVVCTEVLEHCIDPDKLIAEIGRVLKERGKLFLTVPFIWGEHETPYDFRRYSSFGIKKLIEGNDFKITEQKKLTTGIKAAEQLINAEIGHYRTTISAITNLWYKFKVKMSSILWFLLIKLWHSTYKFNRIYIHNLVIAEKNG